MAPERSGRSKKQGLPQGEGGLEVEFSGGS